MPLPVDDIIDRLGGAEAAARLTGVGFEAVRKWRQARRNPVKTLERGDCRHGTDAWPICRRTALCRRR